MTARAVLKRANSSAQKARLVADQIRGLPVGTAVELLRFNNKKAAKLVEKVVSSAIANAQENLGVDLDDLYIHEIFVDNGPMTKRFRARARGRANQILKRTCHISVTLADAHTTTDRRK